MYRHAGCGAGQRELKGENWTMGKLESGERYRATVEPDSKRDRRDAARDRCFASLEQRRAIVRHVRTTLSRRVWLCAP